MTDHARIRGGRRARATPVAAVALVALQASVTACFIPVNITERASPPLWGELRRGDGTPATRSVVAVASANERDDTRACTRSSVRATVDSAGTFQLPGTTHRLRWLMIVPAFERFGSSYLVCAGDSDSTLHPVYHGRTSLSPTAPGDTLSCLEWSWQDRARTTCAKPEEKAVVTAGRWVSGGASGVYRVVRTEEGPIAGPDGDFVRPRLLVQWVARRTAAAAPDTVVAAVMLPPSTKKLRNLHSLRNPHFYERREGWCLIVESSRMTLLDSDQHEEITFVLGAPGEARMVESCPVPAPLAPP